MRIHVIAAALAALALAACGAREAPKTQGEIEAEAQLAAAVKAAEEAEARDYAAVVPVEDKKRACRAAVATIMGRDPAIMRAKEITGGIIQVEYVRADDGTRWSNVCRVRGSTVEWAANDLDGPGTGIGRWRDEDRIGYSIEGSKVSVKWQSGGELMSQKEFTIP